MLQTSHPIGDAAIPGRSIAVDEDPNQREFDEERRYRNAPFARGDSVVILSG
jgi:hypothetical protein